VKHLNQQVSSIKREKAQLECNFAALEKQMDDLKGQNKQLAQAKEKSSLSQKERKVFQQQVDELQSQVGNLVRDKKQLEAELDFMKQQNGELRTEIAIILEENDKMEHELTELEEDFEKQEVQLDSATEETKNLLRQLCSAESKNLQLSTIAHDFENYQSELKKLGEEKCDAQSEKNTIHDRLIMAELEISRLKSELKAVEYQRQLLLDDLDAADKERSVLKGELQNLARAISPLKREVNAAILKNDDHVLTVKCDLTYSKLASDKESLEKHTSEQPKALPTAEPVNELSIQDEINLVQAEMEGYARERQEIDEEQSSLQQRLSCLKRDREDMRSKLHDLIQDIDERNRMKHEEPMTEIEDSMKLISFLIAQRDNLDQEKVLVETNLMDANDKKKKLNIKVGTACEQLKNSQEDMLLASIGHMKLNERVRKIDRCMSEIKYSDSEEIYGLTRLQEEVKKLKVDIRNFETSQESLLCEVRTLNEQLDIAENNLVNVTHFRNVIENNIREYKHRNSTLESHLRSIYSDLVQMEAHECEEKPSVDVPVKSTKILLETLDLQKHLDFLEKDLKKTENKHVDLVQDTIDLTDRCSQLEEEKHMHDINQEQTQESIASQLKLISQLQKDKESLMYDKSRLSTKLSLYRDDKNRLLDDFQRLNKSLTAYARYNSELEQKLQSFQSEMDELEMQAKYVSTENQMKIVKALTSSGSNGHSSNLLCPRCTEKMRKRFEGVTAKGTLQRGDQLLDCVNDNLSLETAILTFMNQKGHLEQQLMNIDQDRRQLEDMLRNLGCADSNHSTLRYNADGSQTQIDEEFIKRLWSSGQLSSRSKSMTSHSGDSFLDDDDDSGTNPSSSRSHTALGIYKSSNPTSRTSSLACSPPTSPPTTRAATTSPLASRRQPAPTLSPQMGRRRRKLSNDEAYESQELSKESGGESCGNNLLESLNEEASGCRIDEAATTSNSTCSSKDSTNNQNQKDELAGKSSHHGMSGFLKKFRSSKRGSTSKRSSSKPGVDRALSPQSVSSRTSSDTDSHAHDAHAHDSHTQQGAL
jgi:chromosome segregation ATPase